MFSSSKTKDGVLRKYEDLLIKQSLMQKIYKGKYKYVQLKMVLFYLNVPEVYEDRNFNCRDNVHTL